MYEYVYIGYCPAEEDCAQVGAANYAALSRLEMAQYKQAIIQKCGEPPSGVELVIYAGEVCARYNPATAEQNAIDWAWALESQAPSTWAEVNMKAPRLDDEEFSKTELITPPEKGRYWMGGEPKCDLQGTQYKASECNGVTNEFVDGVLKIGQWACMCMACFGKNGRGLGAGVGQRYKKATDGKFYKVEG